MSFKTGKITELQKAIRDAMVEAAQSVINARNLNNIKDHLLTLPGAISVQKSKVAEVAQVVEERKMELAQEEAILASMIAAELDPKTNKPLYSNQSAREAELIIRKKNSPEYNVAEGTLRDAERALSSAQAKLEELQDNFRAYRMLARIACTELAIFGGENIEEVDSDVY